MLYQTILSLVMAFCDRGTVSAIMKTCYALHDEGIRVLLARGVVLKDERESFQTTRPDVELRCSVLIQDSRNTGERCEQPVSIVVVKEPKTNDSRPQVSATMAMATVLHTRL